VRKSKLDLADLGDQLRSRKEQLMAAAAGKVAA
jgi:hypothetical protein